MFRGYDPTIPPPSRSLSGLKSAIENIYNPQLSSELERLFLVPDVMTVSMPLAMPPGGRERLRHGSGDDSNASSPGSASTWEEFRQNGKDQELDELDCLVRGMEQCAAVGKEPEPLQTLSLDIFPPMTGGMSPLYPSLSASPGSDCSSDNSSINSSIHGLGNTFGVSNALVTKARILEILKEREQDRMIRKRQIKGDKVCVFCRNNGESEAVYTTHQLKDAQSRVTCPVLYIYTCPICGASGEHAHTIKYCPLNPNDRKAKNPMKTLRSSAGQRRR